MEKHFKTSREENSMANILLCCNEGMSTSFLVKKMQQVADDNGLKVKIWAVSEPKVDTESKLLLCEIQSRNDWAQESLFKPSMPKILAV